MEYTMGSFFSGSGGFELAGHLTGVKALWASEIEPFPIMVTQTRFPGCKHLGDINRLDGAKLEPVDIVTGGSPCQDMSVAGNRTGTYGYVCNLDFHKNGEYAKILRADIEKDIERPAWCELRVVE